MIARSGQTFALVHLIELVLAALVIAIVGVGILSMINGIQFYEQFYARDSAYMLEAMHAVPNGNMEYGYLWASPDFYVTVQPGAVIVAKANPQLGGLIQGAPVTKAYGRGTTLIEPIAFTPQYFVFSLQKGIINSDGTSTDGRISVRQLSAARECKRTSGFSGISAAPEISGDTVGNDATKAVVAAVRDAGSGTSGLRISILYEAAPERQISVIDRASTELTGRIACVLTQQSGPSGIPILQTALSIESPRLQSIDADIIIVMRGTPSDIPPLRDAIIAGLVDGRGGKQ